MGNVSMHFFFDAASKAELGVAMVAPRAAEVTNSCYS